MSGLPGDPPDSYPATLSAGVALVASLGACFAGSTGAIQSAPLLLEAGGLTLFAGGAILRRRTYRLAGRTVTASGFVLAISALVGIGALSPPLSTLLAFLSCGLGVLLVALGVFPAYITLARPLAITGLTLVFVGVMGNVMIGNPPFWRSTVAVTLVFLSWDASQRAITLGTRLGGTAETRSVEGVGIVVSTIVAGIAIVLTVVVSRIPVDSPSLVGLALLLVATTAFVLALSHVPRVSEPPR